MMTGGQKIPNVNDIIYGRTTVSDQGFGNKKSVLLGVQQNFIVMPLSQGTFLT